MIAAMSRRAVLLVGFAVYGGCGGDPVDATGSYSIAVTNRANGCEFDNWNEGDTASNIPVTVAQDGDEVTATVEGLTGGFLSLALGSNVFAGTVEGNDLSLTLFGTTSTNEGNCTYTINAVLDGTLEGDVLQGEIRYESATNGNPDCAAIEGCASVQDFNGTRPPT